MIPHLELESTVTPTPVNPLGAKGVGEAGTIGSTPCVVNAVLDAVRPLGVKTIDMPLWPEKIWRAMQDREGRCGDDPAPNSLITRRRRSTKR